MTEQKETDEYMRMYNSGYVTQGIKLKTVRCRHCGNTKDCAESSEFYLTKTCGSCKRKLDKNR